MTSLTVQKSKIIKYWATGLLFFSMILFIISKIYENQHPVWPWLLAFSEAAMIGALADWFAVTALFRHPLGLPIPHTAIIPKSQGRISVALSRFVEDNFLTPESLTPRLRSGRYAERIVEWILLPQVSKTVALQIKDFLSAVLSTFNDRDTTKFFTKVIRSISKEIALAPLAAELLASVGSGDKQGKLFSDCLNLIEKLLVKHDQIIERIISRELPWYIPSIVKHHLYRQISTAISKTVVEMQADPEHLLRKQLGYLFQQAIHELKSNQEWEGRLQDEVNEACERPALLKYLSNVQEALLTKLMLDQSGVITENISNIILLLAQDIKDNKDILAKINDTITQVTLRIVKDYGSRTSSFIEETMSSWDSKVLSLKIESEVGRDLQFIRINGTLVGGLVGLILHGVIVLMTKL